MLSSISSSRYKVTTNLMNKKQKEEKDRKKGEKQQQNADEL
jgi:hypothetical protein